jgi:hypothetical protein
MLAKSPLRKEPFPSLLFGVGTGLRVAVTGIGPTGTGKLEEGRRHPLASSGQQVDWAGPE